MQNDNLFIKKLKHKKNNTKKLFAMYKNKVYMINSAKLDVILSIMKILYEFIDYTTTIKENNITEWLRNKNLLEEELLEEICYEILE